MNQYKVIFNDGRDVDCEIIATEWPSRTGVTFTIDLFEDCYNFSMSWDAFQVLVATGMKLYTKSLEKEIK